MWMLKEEIQTTHVTASKTRVFHVSNQVGKRTKQDSLETRNINLTFFLNILESKHFIFISGVLNLAPCKRSEALPKGAPIALSFPHFYQADPSFLEAVGGLSPTKEKHEFYVDISPQFGFPLAIRPRFQLNAIIRRDTDIDIMRLVALTLCYCRYHVLIIACV